MTEAEGLVEVWTKTPLSAPASLSWVLKAGAVEVSVPWVTGKEAPGLLPSSVKRTCCGPVVLAADLLLGDFMADLLDSIEY